MICSSRYLNFLWRVKINKKYLNGNVLFGCMVGWTSSGIYDIGQVVKMTASLDVKIRSKELSHIDRDGQTFWRYDVEFVR